jgi:hypothetical protein
MGARQLVLWGEEEPRWPQYCRNHRRMDPRERSRRYNDYLMSEAWHEQRRRALEAARHKCEGCGDRLMLQVHHVTYDHIGNERPGELVVLCRDCHEDQHRW